MGSNSRDIKKRLGSIKNTQKVTKSMEMIAAVKMQKVIAQVDHSRKYQELALKMAQACLVGGVADNPLLQANESSKELWVVMSSNRGLCGNFNTNIYKKVHKAFAEVSEEEKMNIEILALGNRSAQIARSLDINVIALFEEFSDKPTFDSILPIIKLISDSFLEKTYSKVRVFNTEYSSSMSHEVVINDVLPVQKEMLSEVNLEEELIGDNNPKFEPSDDVVLDYLLPRMLQTTIYQAVLESSASEHSSRMMAMKTATDSANDIIDDLVLEYNKSRQSSITQEMAEIVGGMEVQIT